MSGPRTARTAAEQPMTMEARLHQRRLTNALAVVEAEQGWLNERIEAECRRLGCVVIPADPYLLDVLACIRVEDDGRWSWLGITNNYGVPTLRMPGRGERTVVRYLAEALGLIAPTQGGMLYPTGDPGDVNPWKRKLRGTERCTGNPHRFAGPNTLRGATS